MPRSHAKRGNESKTILISISVHFIAIGGFAFAIGCSFDIIASFTVLVLLLFFAFVFSVLLGLYYRGIYDVD